MKIWTVQFENQVTEIQADRIALAEDSEVVLFLKEYLHEGKIQESLVGSASTKSLITVKQGE